MGVHRSVKMPHLVDLATDAEDAALPFGIEDRRFQIFRSRNEAPLTLCTLRVVFNGKLARLPLFRVEGIKVAARVINDRSTIGRRVASIEILVLRFSSQVLALRRTGVQVAHAFVVGDKIDSRAHPEWPSQIAIKTDERLKFPVDVGSNP